MRGFAKHDSLNDYGREGFVSIVSLVTTPASAPPPCPLSTTHRPLPLRFRLDESQVAVGSMVDDVDPFAVGVTEDDGARA